MTNFIQEYELTSVPAAVWLTLHGDNTHTLSAWNIIVNYYLSLIYFVPIGKETLCDFCGSVAFSFFTECGVMRDSILI